jgi:hypothetical protein
MKKQIKRLLRISAFAIGSGIVLLAAGSIGGMSPIDAAILGGTAAIMIIAVPLLFEYASKGQVTDEAFDKAINTGIQQVKADTEKKKN